ncbi:hypothetical protein BS78_04G130400 [Paspalum vaginatum]|nr:hypothetical protein BS78_04G130400 [Paspalum vaginatum]
MVPPSAPTQWRQQHAPPQPGQLSPDWPPSDGSDGHGLHLLSTGGGAPSMAAAPSAAKQASRLALSGRCAGETAAYLRNCRISPRC